MVQYIKGQTLKEALELFEPRESLDKQFQELAKYFLYGGYIHVNSDGITKIDRKIYIREVEFYFYDETHKLTDKKDESAIKVYHRNNSKYYSKVPCNPKLPIGKETHYFKKGSLYLHSSGVDITFENYNNMYRASALIRAFSVEEKVGDKYELLPLYIKDGQDNNIDTRSTYIYEYLFEGLSLFDDTNYSIRWVPIEIDANIIPNLEGKKRVNYPGKMWRFVWKEIG